GSRGANGVVLITTKKGRSGKTRLDLSLYNGMGRVTRFMDQMDTEQYLEMRREAFANDGIAEYPANAYDVNGTWDQNRYTDWQKELIGGTAYSQRAQISISGGSENTSFLVSSSLFNETSVFKGDGSYKKGAVHTQLGHRSNNDKLTLNLSLNYTTDQNDQAGTDLTREALNLAPNAPALYDRDGKLNWENGTWNNPLRHLESDFNAQTKTLVANSVVGYQLPWGFALKANLGYTEMRLKESRTLPNTIYNPSYGLDTNFSTIYLNKGEQSSWIVEPQLQWNANLGALELLTFVGSSFQERNIGQIAQNGTGFTSNNLIHSLGAASIISILQDMEMVYCYQAFFGRVNLNFHKKYFLNLTGRRDGSSRFGPDRQFATFGAIGAAWLFSEEDFIKKSLPLLSFGKLRASYGITGNDQIGDYQYLDTYTTTDNNYNGAVGLSPSRLYNPNFGWETNKKLEVGLELGLWQDRLFLTTSWYRNRSGSQLVGIPMPGTTGFSSLQANLDAIVQNRGVELELSTTNIQKKDFSWTSSFNVSIAQNKLLSFPDLEGSTYVNRLVLGQPLNIQKLYRYTGIDSSTGIYGFEDVDGDGQLTMANDRPVIKELNPVFFGGLRNKISVRDWELDFFFQFVKQEGYNFFQTAGRPGILSNQSKEVEDRWQVPGDIATYQQYSTGGNLEVVRAYIFLRGSDAAITDASFLRLKNISLSYTLPKEILGAADCRLYLQGQNLWTLTAYKGMDPETRTFGYLPPLRMMTLGIQLTL
ncbi:MAG TPA: SusC/RagA family TonB-linked outer membrane protein, partial [Arenibacter sp.]|nr:SusC/RagA family TonB-linked outer membrane protein [Arenibacter sp.]